MNVTENVKIEKFTENDKFVVAKRYNLFHRLLHWVNMICMMVFFATGIEIYRDSYPFGGYEFTQQLHVYLGIFIILWSVVFYLIFHIAEGKLHEIIPTPRDILDLILILLCAFKILPDEKYPHYDYYDPQLKVYVNKYHPTQKLLAFGNFVMLIFIGLTGFTLYENMKEGELGLLGSWSKSIVDPIIDFMGIQLRFLHFLIFVYFLVGTSIHFYFTMLPQNRRRLSGMVTGTERIPLH